jgi:NCAIR mutase (PurE)-related protein
MPKSHQLFNEAGFLNSFFGVALLTEWLSSCLDGKGVVRLSNQICDVYFLVHIHRKQLISFAN